MLFVDAIDDPFLGCGNPGWCSSHAVKWCETSCKQARLDMSLDESRLGQLNSEELHCSVNVTCYCSILFSSNFCGISCCELNWVELNSSQIESLLAGARKPLWETVASWATCHQFLMGWMMMWHWMHREIQKCRGCWNSPNDSIKTHVKTQKLTQRKQHKMQGNA